jgi:hypothetical protein
VAIGPTLWLPIRNTRMRARDSSNRSLEISPIFSYREVISNTRLPRLIMREAAVLVGFSEGLPCRLPRDSCHRFLSPGSWMTLFGPVTYGSGALPRFPIGERSRVSLTQPQFEGLSGRSRITF